MTTESRSAIAVLEGKELRAAINEVVSRHLDRRCFSVFLFGSESTGTAMAGSDIDIGILGNEPVPGRTMERIRAGLEELRTLRRFDVIDFFVADRSFRNMVLKDAEKL
jgi:predicted nucleotidyltransferase